ncbi:MAG: hypothetical protein DMG68_07995 [Acidobacteria bacterium]|nr:MAG: hypothetical protein DMG68_07995 [Acidobacteriota bacterium]
MHTPTSYEKTKPFANALARLLEQQHPELVVSDMKKALRVGKVLVDWSQNDEHKTTVSVYSLRARERPTVSTPVTWEEVERVLTKKDPNLVVFEADDVLKRADKMGDVFEPVLMLKQKLPELADMLAAGGVGEEEKLEIAAHAEARAQQMSRKVERRGPPPQEASPKRSKPAMKRAARPRSAKTAATPVKKKRKV